MFVRSCEAAIYNDQAFGVPAQSTNNEVLPSMALLSGGPNPYNTSGNFWTFMQFQLAHTNNFSEFTALYDQYKIQKVKIFFEYGQNSAEADSRGGVIPKLVTFPDYDDRAAVTFTELMQREATTRRSKLSRMVVKTIVPKIKMYGETSSDPSVSSPSATYKRAWIDCSNPNFNHYGLKLAVLDWPVADQGAITAPVSRPLLRVRCEYYVKFRNVR